ncbi:MAG: OmpA family protein [Candidatus Zixiibacteriota bacterium]|nr:MAG: OmpA family protein [candidate division Zixibacteria bacterium]
MMKSHAKKSMIIAIMILLGSSACGEGWRYSVGGGVTNIRSSGSDFFDLGSQSTYYISLGHRLSDRWQLNIGYADFTLSNDTEADRTDSVGVLFNNTPLHFEATRLSLLADRDLLWAGHPMCLSLGFGGGLLFWKALDPVSNTTYTVRGSKQERTDFAATELFVTAATGLTVTPGSRWSVKLRGHIDYLTAAGAEFDGGINSRRDRWLLGVSVSLNLVFSRRLKSFPPARQPVSPPAPTFRGHRLDSDNDGVPDDLDQCLNTRRGVVVGESGCPRDSDRDGVPDGLDDCPATSSEAVHSVDIYGCAVDSDHDGLPDYIDTCPDNRVGALVDSSGCPVDADGDSIPDGLDDCPSTLAGVAVDPHGCIDLEMFSKPMVLNIDYVSGSFEVDPNNKERLKRLAGLLNFVSDIKLEISGYTDNIGREAANRRLSEKRANRVRDYLVTYNVAAERIKVFGRGETSFVASNQTAEGRARNRRVEIIFYR